MIDGPWDVLSLQEVTPPSGLEGNAFPVGPRQCYVGTCNLQFRSALVVHADILPYICKVHTDMPHPAVTISFPGLQPFTTVSAHLPHSAFTADDLMNSANLMFREAYSGTRTIIGVDANVELGNLLRSENIGHLTTGEGHPNSTRTSFQRASQSPEALCLRHIRTCH